MAVVKYCLLDLFPCEILQKIFDYLKPIDVIRSLIDVNDHLTAIWKSYSRLHLNFRAIRKEEFSFLCEHIQADQIRSLILSNERNTPGQIEVFFSRFPAHQLINLHHLTLVHLDDVKYLLFLFCRLENHDQLRSLSIDNSSIKINKKIARQMADVLRSLSSLKSLKYFDSSSLLILKQSLTQLSHLTLTHCQINDLEKLMSFAPNLVSLDLSISYQTDRLRCDRKLFYLRTLKIQSNSWFLIADIEQLFSSIPAVENLILDIVGEQTLLEAQRWKQWIQEDLQRLKTFQLSLSTEENPLTAQDVLLPFQDSFWIDQMHCRMACLISAVTEKCLRLYSVPYFTPTETWYPPSQGFQDVSIVPHSFDLYYRTLRFSYVPETLEIFSIYESIQTLSMECEVDQIDQIEQVLSLTAVQHLKFSKKMKCSCLRNILEKGIHITQLTISSEILIHMIDSFDNDHQFTFEQVKKLHIDDALSTVDIQRISRLFPCLEEISLLITDQMDVLRVTEHYLHLRSAIFRWIYSYKQPPLITSQWLRENYPVDDSTFLLTEAELCLWIDQSS